MNRKDATDTGMLTRALDWACSQEGWWHDSGNLNPAVLKAIANHAIEIGARETAETGCGLSTIVMSAIADCHTCFTVATGNSLERVQSAPHLRCDRVKFVVGPSQLTLARHSFPGPLDVVLIDGPHGFPFAQMEYFYFYQRIRTGGVLVVDDIHIPTIQQMYDVLRDDKMWTHLENVLTTAFFQRTDAPMFDPYGDGWERQQFNQRHFRDQAAMDTYCPSWREAMPPPVLLPGTVPIAGKDEGAAARLMQASAEIDSLRAENAALRASRSWRITAPLRTLSSVLRRH
jgi:predicted O-methyltransferase YrrM